MPVAHFVCPYSSGATEWGKPARWLEFALAAPDSAEWAEAEIDGDRALIRCRASKAVLDDLALTFERVPEPVELPPHRRSVVSGRMVPVEPFESLLAAVPDQTRQRRVEDLATLADERGYVRLEGEPWPEAARLLVDLGKLGYGLDRVSTGTFPTTGILYDFNVADNPFNTAFGNTTILGGATDPSVGGNQVLAGTSAYVGVFKDDVTNYGPDAECYMTAAVVGDYFGIFARMDADAAGAYDAYQASWSLSAPNNLTLQDNDEASQTQIGSSVSDDQDTGDTLGLECIGSTIVCYTKASAGAWTARITTSNSRISAAGRLAFDMYNPPANGRLDNMGGGTVVAGAVDIPYLTMAPPIPA